MLNLRLLTLITNGSLKDQIDSLTSYLCGQKNSCGNKIDYKSRESALRAVIKMNFKRRLDGKKFESYRCWFCKGWHIGGALNLTILKFFRILWFWIKKRFK